MEVDLALLADAATIDGSGKLNILGIFDRLGTGAFPTRHPRMALVLRFSAGVHEVGKHEIEIVLRAPDGGEVVRIDGEMNLAAGPGQVSSGVLDRIYSIWTASFSLRLGLTLLMSVWMASIMC